MSSRDRVAAHGLAFSRLQLVVPARLCNFVNG